MLGNSKPACSNHDQKGDRFIVGSLGMTNCILKRNNLHCSLGIDWPSKEHRYSTSACTTLLLAESPHSIDAAMPPLTLTNVTPSLMR